MGGGGAQHLHALDVVHVDDVSATSLVPLQAVVVCLEHGSLLVGMCAEPYNFLNIPHTPHLLDQLFLFRLRRHRLVNRLLGDLQGVVGVVIHPGGQRLDA